MNTESKTLLYFFGGVLWAALTARKAYAPTFDRTQIANTDDLVQITPRPFSLSPGQPVQHKRYTGPIGGPMDPNAFVYENGVATGEQIENRWVITMSGGNTKYLLPTEMVV